MSTQVKITIIGAGSASFSGTIVRDLCVNTCLCGSPVVFMDVDQSRLAGVSLQTVCPG